MSQLQINATATATATAAILIYDFCIFLGWLILSWLLSLLLLRNLEHIYIYTCILELWMILRWNRIEDYDPTSYWALVCRFAFTVSRRQSQISRSIISWTVDWPWWSEKKRHKWKQKTGILTYWPTVFCTYFQNKWKHRVAWICTWTKTAPAWPRHYASTHGSHACGDATVPWPPNVDVFEHVDETGLLCWPSVFFLNKCFLVSFPSLALAR